MWIPKSVVHDLVGIELEISTPDRRVLIGEDVLSGLPGVSLSSSNNSGDGTLRLRIGNPLDPHMLRYILDYLVQKAPSATLKTATLYGKRDGISQDGEVHARMREAPACSTTYTSLAARNRPGPWDGER